MSTTKFVLGSLSGVVIFVQLVWIAVALHMAYTKINIMLMHLKNCTDIKGRVPFYLHLGPYGRLMAIGAIASAVASPGTGLRTGVLNADDLERFPAHLKRKLVALHWSMLLSLWSMLFLGVIISLTSMHPTHTGMAQLTIAGALAWILLCLRIVKIQGDNIVSNFRNSQAIIIREKLNAGGMFERLLFIIAASIIITCGNFFVRRGTIDSAELHNAPRHLKFKLCALFVVEVALVFSLFALFLIS